MILDIEGREINVGDECYMPGNNLLVKIKIVKETPKSIYYIWKYINQVGYNKWDTYLRKSSNAAGHLIKI